MKKLAIIVLAIVVVGWSLTTTATTQETLQRTQMLGVNPLGLIFNIYSGHYSRLLNNGTSEVNIPFFYWQPLDELTILGAGVKYRLYKDGNGKGMFYGGGVRFFSVSWDYETIYFDEDFNLIITAENVTGVSFTPEAEVGYRWSWENGFTLAPSIGVGFTIGKIEATDGTESEYGSYGLSWNLGLGLAYMF